MRRNKLRELLDADKPSLGTHVHSPWPSVFEMAGHSEQFDYVEYVSEYAPYDLHTMDNIGRAIDLFDEMSAMIKVEQDPRGHIANRAIGAGIQNILFADVRTVKDVEVCVATVRPETPEDGGQHGVNMRRYVRFGMDAGGPEFIQSCRDSVIALMIEKKQAVEDLEALLSVPGVDMVQFGPSDYTLSMGGASGGYGREKVREAEKHVIETSLKMGIAPRAEIGGAEGAKRYLDMGVKHFCVGTDVSILMQWFREEGKAMKDVLENV
ncbi:MAG: aldolase/citrate lyase family protein [Candidatus Latescibacteria bacterium]|jgi:4-hydroxy-2-oxoheptanedioate aldolase|nr:aldolase/citrate lyase family protein [Candidatus Latescibacterota bacterium]